MITASCSSVFKPSCVKLLHQQMGGWDWTLAFPLPTNKPVLPFTWSDSCCTSNQGT